MMFRPDEHIHVPAGLHRHNKDDVDKKWHSNDQGEHSKRVHTRETSLPEIAGRSLTICIGINEDESGKNEEEADPHVADGGEILVPLRASGDFDGVEVEDHHVQGSKEPDGSNSRQPGSGSKQFHRCLYVALDAYVPAW